MSNPEPQINSTLKNTLTEEMKTAMRGHEQRRLNVIRLILAEIKQREVDTRVLVTDEKVIEILAQMVKQRQESIKQYQLGNRQDLVDQESYEIQLIQEFMPTPLSDQEVEQLITNAITTHQASSMQDMSKVMATLKSQVIGRVDMASLSAKIKDRLSKR